MSILPMVYELKECRTYEEDGRYYMSLTYHVEYPNCTCEIVLPKVALGLKTYGCPDIASSLSITEDPYITLDAGGNHYQVLRGDTQFASNVFYAEKVIETKTKKMTVAEIEKKLGYTVEIVAEGKSWHE